MTVEANAKVNLTLEVFAPRADGYHALRSVVMPVSLRDTLDIEVADGLSSDAGYDDDLCLRAARTLREARGVSFGARIHVVKRIPVGGGLGGGSADAAATLVALNGLWRLGMTRAELAELGAQVGSDVPALALGGAVLMEGRGERVGRISGGAFPSLDLVLAAPRVPSSTARVYAACLPRHESSPDASAAMVAALRTGDRAAIAASFTNDLQDAATRLCPAIGDALSALREAGVRGVSMSGSGSAVFGLVSSELEGRAIAAELERAGFWARHARTVG